MNATQVFSTKAEKYARYRWDYAPAALQALFDITSLGADAVAVDLGAGTGILTRHLAGRVRRTFAVEPNAEMIAIAARDLARYPTCRAIAARAEAVPLADRWADLVTVAQALHWFVPDAARAEFVRLLKPGGWLAVLRNRSTSGEIDAALAAISTPENGVAPDEALPRAEHRPMEFFYGHDRYQSLAFRFSLEQDWPAFIGGVTSASYMPDEGHPAYPRFERAAREVFERFACDGRLIVQGETDLWVGQVR